MANLNVQGVIKEQGKRVLSPNYKPSISISSSSNYKDIDMYAASSTSERTLLILFPSALKANQAVGAVQAISLWQDGGPHRNDYLWVLDSWSNYNSNQGLQVHLKRHGTESKDCTIRISYTILTITSSLPQDTSTACLDVSGILNVRNSGDIDYRVLTQVPSFSVVGTCWHTSFTEQATYQSKNSQTVYLYFSQHPDLIENGEFITGVYAIGVSSDNQNGYIWQLANWSKQSTNLKIDLSRELSSNAALSTIHIVVSKLKFQFT